MKTLTQLITGFTYKKVTEISKDPNHLNEYEVRHHNVTVGYVGSRSGGWWWTKNRSDYRWKFGGLFRAQAAQQLVEMK